MTRDQLDLASRLVARRSWRWVPGMLAERPSVTRAGRVMRLLRNDGRGAKMEVASVFRVEEWYYADVVPDLFATAAIILRVEWEAERNNTRLLYPAATDIRLACNVGAEALLDIWEKH